MKHLFLNRRLFDTCENVHNTLAPCTLRDEYLSLDDEEVWKKDNLHLTWYRDEETGEFHGWHNSRQSTADVPDARWTPHVRRCRSDDGLSWQDYGEPGIAETVICDPNETDPSRRFKCVYQGIARVSDEHEVLIPMDRYPELMAAANRGEEIRYGMFSACSADGTHWTDHQVVVVDTHRVWLPPESSARQDNGWWKPGTPGWSGGDSFPCLLHLPEQGKFVAFFRTNIDRRTSLQPKQRRRERGVGRAECTTFGEWSPHELALRADVDWQHMMGHGKQDFYQLQVWPVADVYLGALSVFYWDEDRNHIELAWSPDTIHWERICPGTDLIPHGTLPHFGGGSNYASMRPQEIDGEVRLYFGADNGRHNADGETKESTLMLASFQPDRFAGVTAKAEGRLESRPLRIEGDQLNLNVDARSGQIRIELRDEEGQRMPGHSFDDCEPIRADVPNALATWCGSADLGAFRGRRVRLAFEINSASLYAFST